MHEKLAIADESLRACLQDQYGLAVTALEFLPLGLDTRAGVYRVVSEDGTAYLLKVKSGPLYEPSRLVPRYLHDQGITGVVAPLPTQQNTLWTWLADWEGWTVTLYPFIAGDRGWEPSMTDAQWRVVGAVFKQVHKVNLPPEGIPSLRRETFDMTGYARSVRTIAARLASDMGATGAERTLRASWLEHQSTIDAMLSMMESLAEPLRKESGPHGICHADLHPSNIIRPDADHAFVIDWDDVMLAPKERDFIFVADTPENGADGAVDTQVPPFFQGYGATEIDWVALTYYRLERVVTDVIECAQNAWFRDDLGEATKAAEARLFGLVLAPGAGMVDAAWAAAARLPASLGLPNARRA